MQFFVKFLTEENRKSSSQFYEKKIFNIKNWNKKNNNKLLYGNWDESDTYERITSDMKWYVSPLQRKQILIKI